MHQTSAVSARLHITFQMDLMFQRDGGVHVETLVTRGFRNSSQQGDFPFVFPLDRVISTGDFEASHYTYFRFVPQ